MWEPTTALGLIHARRHTRFDEHEGVDEVVALHRHVAQEFLYCTTINLMVLDLAGEATRIWWVTI